MNLLPNRNWRGFRPLPFDKWADPDNVDDLTEWNGLKSLTYNPLLSRYGYLYKDWLIATYQPNTSAQKDALIARFGTDVAQFVNFLAGYWPTELFSTGGVTFDPHDTKPAWWKP